MCASRERGRPVAGARKKASVPPPVELCGSGVGGVMGAAWGLAKAVRPALCRTAVTARFEQAGVPNFGDALLSSTASLAAALKSACPFGRNELSRCDRELWASIVLRPRAHRLKTPA